MSGDYVLLWSQKQNAVRVIPVGQMLVEAMRDYRDNRAGDYRALFVGSARDCQETAANLTPTLTKRETRRGLRLVHGGAA